MLVNWYNLLIRETHRFAKSNKGGKDITRLCSALLALLLSAAFYLLLPALGIYLAYLLGRMVWRWLFGA